MTEQEQAKQIAEKWLDFQWNQFTQMVRGDPDCDAVVLARSYIRLLEQHARSSERSDEAMIEAVREVCARQAERFYDNPNLEDHLKPALEVARICGKQISDSIRKLHFNDDFRASVSSHVTEKTDG